MANTEKNNVASEALLEMNTIVSAIKEESKNSLKSMLSEAVKDALRESCDEEDEKDCEISDEEEKNDTEETEEAEKESETTETEEEKPAEGDDEVKDEWEDYTKYKVGDNTYDLTGEKDVDTCVKVYKLLTDDDNIVIRKEGDKINLKDNENNTEYVIDINGDGEETENKTELDESADDIAGIPSDTEDEDEDISLEEFEIEFPDQEEAEEEEVKDLENNKDLKTRKPMKEKEDVLFEVDLGYTDDYQDKDPIAGLSNDEPSKNGRSWDKGIPTTAKKPWAGDSKSKGNPFANTVNEEAEIEIEEEPVEEGTNVGGAVQQRSNSKSHIPAGRKEYGPKVKRHVSAAGEYDELVAEAKTLKKENRELKNAVIELKKSLNEAYVTNVNLGKITKLFLENTTSQKEKIEIVNRFSNEAKTIEQSQALYESIDKSLKSVKTNAININETSQTANGTKNLNENKVYQSNDLMKTIDLMKRVQGC